jgi:hypothetical protein
LFIVGLSPLSVALDSNAATGGGILLVAYLVAGAAATFMAYRRDTLRRTCVLLYELEDQAGACYQALHDAFETLAKCGGCWNVQARGATSDQKYDAGASQLIRRNGVTLTTKAPPIVQTNIAVPAIPAGRETLYLFPDRLLVFSADGVGAVRYQDLNIEVSSSRFIESERVPNDAKIVGQTWKYVNKNGGPDKRFKDNRQLPIALYEELHFSSSSGLNEVIQVSRTGVGSPLAQATAQLATPVVHRAE